MRYKIGILTFHRAHNYGAVLQNLALVTALKNMNPNNQVNTVDYRCTYLETPYKNNPFDVETNNPIKFIWYMLRKQINQPKYERLVSGFDNFRKKYLCLTKSYSKSQIQSVESEFDVFITGSDQVWNDKITNSDEVYSLGFVKKAKKVSYAASAGSIKHIGDSTFENIKTIDAISVREPDLQNYLKDKLDKQVELVVDPVFLIPQDMWNGYLNQERIVKDKYIFTYSVSEKTDEVIKIAKQLAREYGYQIIHLDHSLRYGLRGKKMYGAGPLEFVQLIRDAEIVVASSFHAVAFSIIFNKRFVVVPTEKTGARIESLLELVNLDECSVSSYQEYQKKKERQTLQNTRMLERQINDSLNFLKNILA